jgi:hypothetical protein
MVQIPRIMWCGTRFTIEGAANGVTIFLQDLPKRKHCQYRRYAEWCFIRKTDEISKTLHLRHDFQLRNDFSNWGTLSIEARNRRAKLDFKVFWTTVFHHSVHLSLHRDRKMLNQPIDTLLHVSLRFTGVSWSTQMFANDVNKSNMLSASDNSI